MWINKEKITESSIYKYQNSLLNSCPNYIVIDDLFSHKKLDEITRILQESNYWKTQKHTYSSLYVNNAQWSKTSIKERFVQRDAWRYKNTKETNLNPANEFLKFLRSEYFMSILSRIFNVYLTDLNVASPTINTNYFRLGSEDFVELHADDSPGRKVCMLLYLNKNWHENSGGELVFNSKKNPINITPFYNRCVLFDPSSEGSEHWVKKLKTNDLNLYRYNVTSWYWSE